MRAVGESRITWFCHAEARSLYTCDYHPSAILDEIRGHPRTSALRDSASTRETKLPWLPVQI